LLTGQVRYASCDSGPAVDPRHCRKGPLKLFAKQWKVSAGQNANIDAIAVGSIEHRLSGSSNCIRANLLARELCLGEIDQLGGALADNRSVGSKLRREIVDVGRADR